MNKAAKNRILSHVLISVIGMAFWAFTWPFDFISLDDPQFILKNPHFDEPLADQLAYWLTNAYQGHYHPVTWMVFAGMYKVFGPSAWAFRILSSSLHILNAHLIFNIFRQKFAHNYALMASVMFLIHPMVVEPVVWISAFSTLLYTFFSLICLQTILTRKRLNALWFLFVFLSFLLALGSKSPAVALSAIIPFLLYSRNTNKFIWALKSTSFIVMGFLITVEALSAASSFGTVHDLTEGQSNSAWHVLNAFGYYFRNFFIPTSLQPYHYKPEQYSFIDIAVVVISLLLFLSLLIRFRKKRTFWYGFAIYTLAIGPYVQIVSVGEILTASRYSYFAILGILWMFLDLITLLSEKEKWRISIPYVLMGLIVLFGSLSWFQSQKWSNDLDLYSSIIKSYPDKAFGYYARGVAHYNRNNLSQARADLVKAKKLEPTFRNAYLQLGNVLASLDDVEGAMNNYRQACDISPTADTHFNLGWVYKKVGKLDSAKYQYTKSIEMDPSYYLAYYNRSRIYIEEDQIEFALDDLNRALTIQRNFKPALKTRGMLYIKLDRTIKACRDFQRLGKEGEEFIEKYCHEY